MVSAAMLDFSTAPHAAAPAHDSRPTVEGTRRRLIDSLESWLPNVLPGGRVERGHYICGSTAGERGQSLRIALHGPKRGLWRDWATDEGGDAFSLIQAALGCDFRAALDWAEGRHGAAPARRATAPQRAARPQHDSRPLIARILRDAEPDNAIAAAYLAGRGITIDLGGADIRSHRRLVHSPTGKLLPAMLGIIRNVGGDVIGLHRTYLERDGERYVKAPVEHNKMILGSCAGGAVRLANETGGPFGVCEGVETGLAAMQMRAGLTVWAALSTSGLRGLELPASVVGVNILADFDEPSSDGKRPGTMAAETLVAKLRQAGKRAQIVYPPNGAKDFNDALQPVKLERDL